MSVTPKVNRIGLEKKDYAGSTSTMCKGCGHDRISEAIVQSAYDLGLEAHRMIKMSGIGCSSKTPAYFIGNAYGFNSTHGRMPSFATGAHLANHDLVALGVSGDGDSASIGIGQFIHMIRRNPKLMYVVENNGVYGLTKGQFSATADTDSPSKRGKFPTDEPIDLCGLALELGAGFVARSFSGDKKQLIPLLKAALSYDGLAVVDVISPCVTFNNHDQSTKSYTYFKEHETHFHLPSYVPEFEHIDVEYDPGETREVALHDGSKLRLQKLEEDFDPTDRDAAFKVLHDTRNRDAVLTGLVFIDTDRPSISTASKLVKEPLASLEQDVLRPSREALAEFNQLFQV